MKITTSTQLAKTLKSGREAAKLPNDIFERGFPYANNHFQAAGQNFEIFIETISYIHAAGQSFES